MKHLLFDIVCFKSELHTTLKMTQYIQK